MSAFSLGGFAAAPASSPQRGGSRGDAAPGGKATGLSARVSPAPTPACTHTPKSPRPRCSSQRGQEPFSPIPRPSEGSAETWGAEGSRCPPSLALAELGRGFQPGQCPRCLRQGRVPSCSQRQQHFLFKAIVLATFPVQKPEAGANATCAIYFGFFFFFKGSPACKGMRVSLPQTAHQNSLFCNIYSRQFLHVRQGRPVRLLPFLRLSCLPRDTGMLKGLWRWAVLPAPPHTRVGRNPELPCPGPSRRCCSRN